MPPKVSHSYFKIPVILMILRHTPLTLHLVAPGMLPLLAVEGYSICFAPDVYATLVCYQQTFLSHS